jgi:glutamate synthase (NADPH/NADH) small chain
MVEKPPPNERDIMADIRGFLKHQRSTPKRRPVATRITDWLEFYEPMSDEALQAQGGRCMDCGVPFCQSPSGCPVQNMIPDWNDLVHRDRWRDALKALHTTNNFPEFTGRLCPAPCESACVLGIIDQPVSIRNIEQSIIDRGFSEGWVTPLPPARETGKSVAVVGSGPAGLAAAQQLRRLGHRVVLFEKADRLGGLLRYGIPDFKMEKSVLDRRLQQMEAEGVLFQTGVDVTPDRLREFDATCLAIGAMVGRDLPVPGRDLKGVHLAMDYLTQQNKRLAGDSIPPHERITAEGKRVVIIGGGDTGSDCLGTCHRQGAKSVHQFEILAEPPPTRADETPWPLWPMMLRTSHAHEEGCQREWQLATTTFSGQNGHVQKIHAVRLEPANSRLIEAPENRFEMETDLVLLAMGFTGPTKTGLVTHLGVALDARGNIRVDENYMTSIPGLFAAGDAKRGASLIVWAIREGRDAARGMDAYLGHPARSV